MASLQRNLPSWAQVRMSIGLGLGGLGIYFGGWIFLWYRRLRLFKAAGGVTSHGLVVGTASTIEQDLELGFDGSDVYHGIFHRITQSHFGESTSDQAARLKAHYDDWNTQISNIRNEMELSAPRCMRQQTISLWDLEIKKTSFTRSEIFIQGHTDQPPTLDDPEQMIQTMNICADETHAKASSIRVDEESGTPEEADSAVTSEKHESGGDLVCAVCEKQFSKRHELNRHTRLQHARPHKCHVPGCLYTTEGFGKHNDLTRHVRTIHQSLASSSLQEVHLCPVGGCKYKTTGFIRKDHLKRHVTQQHKNLVESSPSIQDLD